MIKFNGTYSDYLKLISREQFLFKDSIINIHNYPNNYTNIICSSYRFINYTLYGISIDIKMKNIKIK